MPAVGSSNASSGGFPDVAAAGVGEGAVADPASGARVPARTAFFPGSPRRESGVVPVEVGRLEEPMNEIAGIAGRGSGPGCGGGDGADRDGATVGRRPESASRGRRRNTSGNDMLRRRKAFGVTITLATVSMTVSSPSSGVELRPK
jgi:hypothetical protein